jgi:N-acetylglucosamine-6-phosphate deacetylase
VRVDASSARLDDGRLAGSLLSLDQALRNLVKFTSCSLQDALQTITQVPARLLHLDTSMGRLAAGARADFVLLTPELEVSDVWIGGEKLVPAAG